MSPIRFTKVDRLHSFQIRLRHYMLATETSSNSFRMCTHVMLMWGTGIRLQRKQFLFSDIYSAATGQDRNRLRLVLPGNHTDDSRKKTLYVLSLLVIIVNQHRWLRLHCHYSLTLQSAATARLQTTLLSNVFTINSVLSDSNQVITYTVKPVLCVSNNYRNTKTGKKPKTTTTFVSDKPGSAT